MKKNLLIVPARGGSKGIPRKNLRYLAGVPLIGHVLNTASNLSNNWILSVNTDDKEKVLEETALNTELVKKWIDKKEPKRIIVIRGKIINIVV